MSKFSELLDEYLTLREQRNSSYYDNCYIETKIVDQYRMRDLAKELDNIIPGVEE